MREMCCRYFQVILPVAVLIAVSCAGKCDAAESDESVEPKSITSYLGNYGLTAPELELAATLAKRAEDVRKLAAKLLGDERTYRVITYLAVSTRENRAAGIDEWRVSMLHGGMAKHSGPLLKHRIENTIDFYIVYCYLLDVAAFEAAAHNSTIRDDQVPMWLCAAVMENLTQEGREGHRDFMVRGVETGEYLKLEKLLRHTGVFESEQARAAYFHQCGSVLDYLYALPDGKDKVLKALRDLYRRDDLVISMLWHFKSEFSSLGELEAGWLEFTRKRPERYFDLRRLSLAETQERLTGLLRVEITIVDEKTIEETIEETDFPGLMAHGNKTARINIAVNKLKQMQDLKLRAPKEYQEVLGEYVLSLKAIIEGKQRRFRRHYRKAGELLEGIVSGGM